MWTRGGAMGDSSDDDERFTLANCEVGKWVEVRTTQREPWRGIIVSVEPNREQPVCVKWVGECQGKRWPANIPENLWTWHGGAHFVEVETLNDISDTLFHVARREEFPTTGLPLKKDMDFYCLDERCNGRCEEGVPPNRWVVPPPQPRKCNTPRASVAKRKADAPPPAPPEDAPPPAPPEDAPKPIYEWEPNVTSDTKPSDVLVPFTYVRERLFSTNDGTGSFDVEPRFTAMCKCKKILEPLLNERVGRVRSLHEGAGGRCPWLALQAGTGVMFKIHIFQDSVGRGYGVRTKEMIPRGQLIIEYVGEVITSTEATRRERSYSQLGLFYLHDIHAHEKREQESYVLDPTLYGNAARMLNHSCEPNVTTLEVSMSREGTQKVGGDPSKLPRVARVGFFTLRDVAAGEELCIDYSPGRHGDDLQKVMRCFCGSPKCKRWLF